MMRVSEVPEKSALSDLVRSAANDLAEIAAEAFAKLLELSWPRLVSTCYGFFPDLEQARDLAREAALKLWNTRERLDPSRNFEALLMTTARNHCIDLLRKELRRGVLAWSQVGSTDAPASGGDDDSPPVIDFIADPDSLAAEDRLRLKDTVERVLLRLEPVDRFILQRRFYSGWTRAEIAAELECSEQNVGIHERKARLLFQKYFAQECDRDKLPT